MPSDHYVTPPQIARRYGVKPAKVYGWIERGELLAVNLADETGGRPRWRVSPEALAAFERRRSSQPVLSPPTQTRRGEIPHYV